MKKNEVIAQDNLLISNNLDIKAMIYEVRGQKVMLDSDLAKLYGYEVKRLNEMVRNNMDRFPDDFLFQLTKIEMEDLRTKFSTANINSKSRYLPYVFTEQGVYALSGILKGPLASAVSINLIRAFKQIKDFYIQNNYLLDRVIDNEMKLIDHDKKLEIVFDYISDHKEVTEKIFYKGQIYDSLSLLEELVKKAYKEILLIDNYIDKNTLDVLAKKNNNVKLTIYTSNNRLSELEINNFNTQYPSLNIHKTSKFHDRFLILDNKTIYLIGASLKDAGNKCFGITEMDKSNIKRIRKELNEK